MSVSSGEDPQANDMSNKETHKTLDGANGLSEYTAAAHNKPAAPTAENDYLELQYDTPYQNVVYNQESDVTILWSGDDARSNQHAQRPNIQY